MPFLRMLIPLIGGIVGADYLTVPVVGLLVVLLGSVVLFILFHEQRMRQVLLVLMLLAAGVAAEKVLAPRETMPRNERLMVSGVVGDNVFTRGRWHRTSVRVTAFRPENDSTARWAPCNEKIVLYVDTAHTVTLGDRVCAVGYINPLDTVGGTSGYARTMRSRGVLGKCFVTAGRLVSCEPHRPESLWAAVIEASKHVQAAIDARLAAFGMDERELGVAMALLSGDRVLLDPDLKEDYAISGVSHILAISGLHMGIIFLLLNYLFAPMLLLRGGRAVRTALVVLALWGFAFVSGLSASVLRAAFMLTVMQISMFTVWNHNSYNALFASAFVLLLVRPGFLSDISFQMSYLALLGILFFYPRFNRWTGVERASAWFRRVRNGTTGILKIPVAFACNMFVFMTGAILVGLSAQLTVLPLVGWAFGRIPLLSVLFNPLIMLVITWLMVAGFAYLLLASVPGLGWLAGVILKWLLERQNTWVEWMAAFPGISIEGVSYSSGVLFAGYALLILVMTGIKFLESRRHQTEPADVQPFA